MTILLTYLIIGLIWSIAMLSAANIFETYNFAKIIETNGMMNSSMYATLFVCVFVSMAIFWPITASMVIYKIIKK